jgi:hypothetical protein
VVATATTTMTAIESPAIAYTRPRQRGRIFLIEFGVKLPVAFFSIIL